MKTILTIVGARPQFIKSAPFSLAIRSTRAFKEVLVHTGQHYDPLMSEVFFEDLGLEKAMVNLEVGSGNHGEQTAKMLVGIEKELFFWKPNLVLVYGDTNSTMAGALVAAKQNIPVAHVEAGLRSFNRRMAEEINRVITDHISEYLFCPTHHSFKNLIREGISNDKIFQVGDIMYDAIKLFSPWVESKSSIVQDLGVSKKGYLLLTIHRAENTDDVKLLSFILQALGILSTDFDIVFPIHPRTRRAIEGFFPDFRPSARLKIIEPQGYLDMLALEKYAQLVVTDSGGVQKEAYFQGVPCVTLRNETEWTELVDLGWNHLLPPLSVGHIVDGIQRALGVQVPLPTAVNPFGEGDTADRIVKILEAHFS